jgi:hypothetical protein
LGLRTLLFTQARVGFRPYKRLLYLFRVRDRVLRLILPWKSAAGWARKGLDHSQTLLGLAGGVGRAAAKAMPVGGTQ